MIRSCPSFVRILVSKFSRCLTVSTISFIFVMIVRRYSISGYIRSQMVFLPITSPALYPLISSAVLFQTLTFPFSSNTLIQTFALSMMLCWNCWRLLDLFLGTFLFGHIPDSAEELFHGTVTAMSGTEVMSVSMIVPSFFFRRTG